MAEENTTTTSIPEEQAEPATVPVKRRRKRRTAACAQCRNRKLKCDQEYPICGRCAKGPMPSDCTYRDASQQLPGRASSSASQAPPAGLGQNATVRVPDRNGDASAPRGHTLPERSQPDRAPAEPGVNANGVNENVSRQCPSSKNNTQVTTKNLDSFFPSPKRRKTGADGARVLSGNLPEIDEHYSRDYLSQVLEIPTKTYWRGKDCWSRFYGNSIVVNMISEFTDLKTYAKETKAENPVLSKFRHDMMAVKERNHSQKLSAEKNNPSTIDSTFLFNLLPARNIVEPVVSDYLTYIEPTHRVFHIPSFRRDLDEVWGQPPANIQPTILVQLLLVLASAWIFHKDAGNMSTDETSMTCDTAKNWIRKSESWLQNNSVKRPGPAVFRIRCLLIIAKEANATRRSQAWSETGSLLKSAMATGYHREPDAQYAKISGFNREMRRRLWVTMVELDLQASLDRGMPPTVQHGDFDSTMPSNFDDEEIREEEELPQPSPSDVVTDSSFQIALTRSLPLRLKICSLVNAPRIRASYEDLHWLEGEVMRHLSHISNWQSPDPSSNPQQQQQFLLWRTILETKLSQTLLSLLTSIAPEVSIQFTHFPRTRLEIATNILCQQQRLLSDTNDGDGSSDANSKLSALHPLTSAPLQAALVICHHLYSMDSGYTSKAIYTFLPSLPLSFLSLVEKTLSSLEPKIVLLEKGLKEYYILSMIISLVKTKIAAPEAPSNSSAAATNRREAVDRAAVLGYRVLAKKREKFGDWSGWGEEYRKKKQKHKYGQQQQQGQQQPPPPPPPQQQQQQQQQQSTTQHINTVTTPISIEQQQQTPTSLDNLQAGTGTGTGGEEDLNNIQIPALPQNFNFDFDFDLDFLMFDDMDVDMDLGEVGNVTYPGQNLGGDGFGNFY